MEQLEAYYATEAFQEYLRRKSEWEFAHLNYTRNPISLTRDAYAIARGRMDSALDACRNQPEHYAAFGW